MLLQVPWKLCFFQKHLRCVIQMKAKTEKRRTLPLYLSLLTSLIGGVPPEAAGEADCANRHDEDELVDSGTGRVVLQGQEAGQS